MLCSTALLASFCDTLPGPGAKGIHARNPTSWDLTQGVDQKTWRQDSFKVSPDPDPVEKVRDLVGLYMNPLTPPRTSRSTRSPRSRRWTAPLRPCPCCPPTRPGPPTTMSATDPGPLRRIPHGSGHRHLRHPRQSQPERVHRLFEQNQPQGPRRARRPHHLAQPFHPRTHKTPKVQRWLLRYRRFTSTSLPPMVRG